MATAQHGYQAGSDELLLRPTVDHAANAGSLAKWSESWGFRPGPGLFLSCVYFSFTYWLCSRMDDHDVNPSNAKKEPIKSQAGTSSTSVGSQAIAGDSQIILDRGPAAGL